MFLNSFRLSLYIEKSDKISYKQSGHKSGVLAYYWKSVG